MRRLWIPMKCTAKPTNMTALFEQQSDGWYLTKTTTAGGSGAAGNMNVSGSFMVSADYPGCIGCRKNSFVRCGRCGNLSCSQFEDTYFSCPWCGDSGTITLGVNEIRAVDGG